MGVAAPGPTNIRLMLQAHIKVFANNTIRFAAVDHTFPDQAAISEPGTALDTTSTAKDNTTVPVVSENTSSTNSKGA